MRGLIYQLQLNYEVNNNNFSLSFLHSGKFALFDPQEYIRSFDFSMRGLMFPFPFKLIIKKDFYYSLIGKIGISYNESRVRTELLKDDFFDNRYDSKLNTGFGLPIEIELREEITSFFGLDISFFANFNGIKNYSGFNLKYICRVVLNKLI